MKLEEFFHDLNDLNNEKFSENKVKIQKSVKNIN